MPRTIGIDHPTKRWFTCGFEKFVDGTVLAYLVVMRTSVTEARLGLVVVLLAWVAGCTFDDRGLASPRGEPAVVLLSLGRHSCSGTLVAPRVILTTRGCVADVDPQVAGAFFGEDPSGAGDWREVKDVVAQGDDALGAVILAEDAPAAPLSPSTDPVTAALMGEPVRVIGHDAHGAVSQGAGELDDFDAMSITIGVTGGACGVDRGGPVLLARAAGAPEEVVGVSGPADASCEDGLAPAVRVDAHAAWIAAVIAAQQNEAQPIVTADVTAAAEPSGGSTAANDHEPMIAGGCAIDGPAPGAAGRSAWWAAAMALLAGKIRISAGAARARARRA